MKNGKVKVFTAVFTGNMVFFFLYAAIAWGLTFLRITPYGKFVSAFFKGRTRDEAKAYMQANQETFNSMLAEAARFSNLFITPLVGFVMGAVVGLIIGPKRRACVIWSLISVAPLALLFLVKSGADPMRFAYLLLLLGFTALGGFAGSALSERLSHKKEAHDVQA